MKTIVPIVGLVALLTGCSNDNVAIRLTDLETGKPISRILIEKYEPSSLFQRIFNPVGSGYHPLSLSETYHTDTNGTCIIQKVTPRDVYRLYDSTFRSITVNIGTNDLYLPHPTNTAWTSWVYSFWWENDSVEMLLEQNVSAGRCTRPRVDTELTVIRYCLNPFGTFEVVGSEINGIRTTDELTQKLTAYKASHPKAQYEMVSEVKCVQKRVDDIAAAIQKAGIQLQHYWVPTSLDAKPSPHGDGKVDIINQISQQAGPAYPPQGVGSADP